MYYHKGLTCLDAVADDVFASGQDLVVAGGALSQAQVDALLHLVGMQELHHAGLLVGELLHGFLHDGQQLLQEILAVFKLGAWGKLHKLV